MSECILKNKLCKNDNCISCFNKSFMSIDKHKFIYDKIEQYNELFYYDDDDNAIKLSKESNKLLTVLLSNTDVKLKEIIKNDLKSKEHTLYVNLITSNKVNRFVTTKVDIQFSNLITVFESFKWT